SYLSVSIIPGGCLRHRCSSTYLRISLLHVEFHPPLTYSSEAVKNAIPRLSPGISHPSCLAACVPFTPSNADYSLHPTYYRGCWHVVSRCLFRMYRQSHGLLTQAMSYLQQVLYNQMAFFHD